MLMHLFIYYLWAKNVTMQNAFFFNIFTKHLIINKIIFAFFLLFSQNVDLFIHAQSPKELYILSQKEIEKGNFIQSEDYLNTLLSQKENIKKDNVVAIYGLLGVLNKNMGKYDKGIAYLYKAETITINNIDQLEYKLPIIYNNLANLFKLKGNYIKAHNYFQEAIKAVKNNDTSQKDKQKEIAAIYQNIANLLMMQEKFEPAIVNLKKSIQIKKDYGFEGIDIAYNNFAICLEETNDLPIAEKYYQKCINYRIKKYGKDYFQLASVYKEFGQFNIKHKDKKKGFELYKKALQIYLKNYASKHPNTANCYEVFGDYFVDKKEYSKALNYYQKSIIANSNSFNSSDIFNNPGTESILSEIQLIRSLKKKSATLIMDFSNSHEKNGSQLKLSLNTLELALKVIQDLRYSFVSTESKLHITENEKEFYILAIENALQLYELNNQKEYIEKAYEFAQKSKAVVLLNEINENEAFLQIIPDQLKEKKSELQQNIFSYKKLIFDENEKREPDVSKISLWQSNLFKTNKEYENLLKRVKKDYP
ncbi:MAG: hypothetical protein DRJ10_10520, partial [Bacteroidetes bacterium]